MTRIKIIFVIGQGKIYHAIFLRIIHSVAGHKAIHSGKRPAQPMLIRRQNSSFADKGQRILCSRQHHNGNLDRDLGCKIKHAVNKLAWSNHRRTHTAVENALAPRGQIDFIKLWGLKVFGLGSLANIEIILTRATDTTTGTTKVDHYDYYATGEEYLNGVTAKDGDVLPGHTYTSFTADLDSSNYSFAYVKLFAALVSAM